MYISHGLFVRGFVTLRPCHDFTELFLIKNIIYFLFLGVHSCNQEQIGNK